MASNTPKPRPYRKASEYLIQARRKLESDEPKSPVELENEELRRKVHALTRKCEHDKVEYMQSREYLENKLSEAQDKYDTLNANYVKLKTKFDALTQVTNQMSEMNNKISTLETDRATLIRNVDDLTCKISESKGSNLKLQYENERLRKDCNLAVQLLRCNKSNYQVKKMDELPSELRERVNETTISLESYNEYINPYGEDSCEEDYPHEIDLSAQETTNKVSLNPTDDVSVDILANVLEKPENIHLDVNESIPDYQLYSSYTARFVDKKLLKVDQDAASKENVLESSNTQPEESSPWELAPSRTFPSSPKYDEDENSAAAYGVYSLPLKRRSQRTSNQPQAPSIPRSISTPQSQVMKSRDGSPDDFRRPLYKSNLEKKASEKSSKEAATRDEKASLLNHDNHESDDDVKASLTDVVILPAVRDEIVEDLKGVDLEWDHLTEDASSSKDNLLLSYNDIETKVAPRPAVASLDEIFDTNDEETGRLKELLAPPEINDSFTAGDMLLESLIKSPPPPPEEFAADDYQQVVSDSEEKFKCLKVGDCDESAEVSAEIIESVDELNKESIGLAEELQEKVDRFSDKVEGSSEGVESSSEGVESSSDKVEGSSEAVEGSSEGVDEMTVKLEKSGDQIKDFVKKMDDPIEKVDSLVTKIENSDVNFEDSDEEVADSALQLQDTESNVFNHSKNVVDGEDDIRSSSRKRKTSMKEAQEFGNVLN